MSFIFPKFEEKEHFDGYIYKIEYSSSFKEFLPFENHYFYRSGPRTDTVLKTGPLQSESVDGPIRA